MGKKKEPLHSFFFLLQEIPFSFRRHSLDASTSISRLCVCVCCCVWNDRGGKMPLSSLSEVVSDSMSTFPFVAFSTERGKQFFPTEPSFACCTCNQGIHSIVLFLFLVPFSFLICVLSFAAVWMTKVYIYVCICIICILCLSILCLGDDIYVYLSI